ncbi:hypothetical protein Tco_0703172 [Tanacetum coccineum]|uniref:DNA-directed RNA polymerase n=1 Tax=Tanacetum coccineum TaxID=301880 RepID=A0ABQ4XYL9_9ASTR
MKGKRKCENIDNKLHFPDNEFVIVNENVRFYPSIKKQNVDGFDWTGDYTRFLESAVCLASIKRECEKLKGVKRQAGDDVTIGDNIYHSGVQSVIRHGSNTRPDAEELGFVMRMTIAKVGVCLDSQQSESFDSLPRDDIQSRNMGIATVSQQGNGYWTKGQKNEAKRTKRAREWKEYKKSKPKAKERVQEIKAEGEFILSLNQIQSH